MRLKAEPAIKLSFFPFFFFLSLSPFQYLFSILLSSHLYTPFFFLLPQWPLLGSQLSLFLNVLNPLGCLYCCLYELLCFWESNVIEWITMGGALVYVHVCACVHECVSKVNWGLVGKCNFASVYSNANGPIETPFSTWNNKQVYVGLCVCVYYCTYMFLCVCVRACLSVTWSKVVAT